MMNMRAIIALLVAGASLAACSAPAEPPPLQGARVGGPFTLTNQDGARVSDRDFAGKYRLIYFGYTFCPDVCPIDLAKLMRGLQQFEQADAARAARVQPIFISVDPERDTPAAIKAFTAQFHPRLIGLTGSAEEIAAAARAYLVRYQRQEGATPGSYLIAHTQLAYLMGPEGEPVALIPIDNPQTPADEGSPALVAAELARWVR